MLYQDWLPFLVAIAYVVGEHGIVAVLLPTAVYNHADAQANPWLWAGIHGAFVLAASAANLAHWRLSESDHKRQQATELSYQRLFAGNPQPMWVFDVHTLAFLDVNDAAVAHYGYSREEFLRMTIADIRPSNDLPAWPVDPGADGMQQLGSLAARDQGRPDDPGRGRLPQGSLRQRRRPPRAGRGRHRPRGPAEPAPPPGLPRCAHRSAQPGPAARPPVDDASQRRAQRQAGRGAVLRPRRLQADQRQPGPQPGRRPAA